MNIFEKIFRGDNIRLSRFHTESGKFADIFNILDLFLAVFTWLRFKATSHYVVKPWWVYSAIRDVDKYLRSTDQVLEVGGGYSTIWLASRCGKVCSIEEDQTWANAVSMHAARKGLNNIEQIIGDSRTLFMHKLGSKWDVVIIDGSRERFAIFNDLLASAAKPRIIIYDDTDKADNFAALSVPMHGYVKRVYRGFKPQTVHTCETTLFMISQDPRVSPHQSRARK